MSAVSDMMGVKWSKDEHSLVEIYNQNTFPLIARVMKGYYGDSPIETVSSGDMLRIHGRGSQKRAIAKECTSGRYFSIPLDIDMYFRHEQSHGISRQVAMRLNDLVAVSELPCVVEVDDRGRVLKQLGQTSQNEHLVTRLEVREVYDAKYLLVNSIINGRLYAEILAVPSYIAASMSLGKGLAASRSTHAQWERQLVRWNSAAANINYAAFKPSQDIMVYSAENVEKSDHIYDAIEPSTYLSLSSVTRSTDKHIYESANFCPPGASHSGQRSRSVDILDRKYIQEKLEPHVRKPNPAPKPQVVPSKAVYMGGSRIRNVSDIPGDGKTLSCEDLVACLYILNMSRYAKSFRENQINGQLLASLGEDIMVDDLGITRIHARKLLMFVNEGWRPDQITTDL